MKQKLLSLLFLLMGMVQGTMAQKEAYAVLSEDKQTVTFYFDDQKADRNGVKEINNAYATYGNAYGKAKNAVFDASFADYRPTSTAYWFMGCKSLTNIVNIENLNTSEVTDMQGMFSWCSLENIDLSNFNTAKVTDMSWMFSYCYSLKSINLNNFNTAKVTDMSRMFFDCQALTSVNSSIFNTAKVTDMSGMFEGCHALTSLDLSNFNTENVTDMSFMFSRCAALTSLNLSNFNTKKVTNMQAMFYMYGGSSLTSLNLISFNTENVTDMSSMFNGCTALTNLDLSKFNTANVTNIEGMFENCANLTILDLSSFITANVMNMRAMFSGCTGLTTIYADEEKWSTAKVDPEDFWSGSSVFQDCTNLIGGNGTKYNWDNQSSDYARIDKPEQPGYLTQKTSSGINSIELPTLTADHYYTLDGRRIEGLPTEKGLYIIGGKKVVVK